MRISLVPVQLELKVNWKISRNESLEKSNFIIRVSEADMEGRGEVAPNIRYGETPEAIENQFQGLPRFSSVEELLDFLKAANLLHSLACGLECAAIEVMSKKAGGSIESYLGIPMRESFPTSISVPIMDESLLEAYVNQNARFPFIKIKVNQANATSFVKSVARLTSKPIRVDANEGFSSLDSFQDFAKQVDGLNIQFIEQPFKSTEVGFYKEVKGKVPFAIMADESIEDSGNFDELALQFDSINIKLMKTGGYRKAVDLIKGAKARNLKVMLGCMIESSLGISCAMRLGVLADYFDLDGSLLIKNDPFELINEDHGVLSFT